MEGGKRGRKGEKKRPRGEGLKPRPQQSARTRAERVPRGHAGFLLAERIGRSHIWEGSLGSRPVSGGIQALPRLGLSPPRTQLGLDPVAPRKGCEGSSSAFLGRKADQTKDSDKAGCRNRRDFMSAQ